MVSRSAGTSMSRIYGIGWTFCMSYSRVNMASMTEMAQRLVHGMNSRGMRRTDTQNVCVLKQCQIIAKRQQKKACYALELKTSNCIISRAFPAFEE